MARSSLKLTLDQRTPLSFADGVSGNTKLGRQALRKVIHHLEGVLGGSVQASHLVIEADGAQPLAAQAVVTCASVANADTVTAGSQAVTAAQKRATGTITFGTSVDNNDTITINGVVFTAKDSSPVAANLEFQNDATAATVAENFLVLLNATTNAGISGIVAGRRSGAVVTVYAVTQGTAGNSITLASDGTDLAVSGATLANGAAVANNAFDWAGSDTTTASALAYAINNSTTAVLSGNFEASNLKQTITVTDACTAGTGVSIAGHQLFARNGLTGAGYGDFDMSSATAATIATSLKNIINAHPVLAHQVFATSSAGVVTVRQRRGTSSLGKVLVVTKSAAATGLSVGGADFAASADVLISTRAEGLICNQVPMATSNGTRLAILGGVSVFAGGAGGSSGTLVRMVMGGSAQ